MRLIDADEFFKDFTELEPYEHISHEYDIDAVEVKHGEWIVDDEFIDCSVCRREKWSRVPFESLVKRFRYCPKCGARMDGERRDDGQIQQSN